MSMQKPIYISQGYFFAYGLTDPPMYLPKGLEFDLSEPIVEANLIKPVLVLYSYIPNVDRLVPVVSILLGL